MTEFPQVSAKLTNHLIKKWTKLATASRELGLKACLTQMSFIVRDVLLEKAGLVFHKGNAGKYHLCIYTHILIVSLVF